MMQVSSQRDPGTVVEPLVLPILKFSYATTSAERNYPLGWTHLSGGADLMVIFGQGKTVDDRSGRSGETRYLKVQRGIEVLEELNLGTLAEQATANTVYSQQQNSKSSVAVLVKTPCLAIRYPTHLNQIRRFQVKFSSDADYTTATSILSEMGCPITESNMGTGNPPATSYQGTPAPSTTASPAPPSLHSRGPADVPTMRPPPSTWQAATPRPSSIGSSSTVSAAPAPRNDNYHNSTRHTTGYRHDSRPIGERPSTAPSFGKADTLSQFLPPKRELPFTKPRRVIPSATNTTNAAGAASPSTMQTSISSTVGQQPGQGVPSHALGDSNREIPTATNYITLPTNQYHTDISQEPPPQHIIHNPSKTSRSPLTTSTPAFINQLPSPTATTTVTAPTAPTSSVAPTTTIPSVPLLTDNDTDLSAFLAAPTPERSAQLESWVCTQLESDGFLALCQEVEGVWRRVAYGM